MARAQYEHDLNIKDIRHIHEGDTALIKTEFYCETCNGTNLVSDGPTKWDFDKQMWVLSGEVYDDTYCEDCECDVRIGSRAVMV
ncbi:hypothetical protein PP761_gp84 [Stenotrophomonas phage Paxi]|uniref:Uncharacterized protein n=1 Tax=Stenotrophomonas phage Paxi TaxID=2859653 RepID=A0AAE8BJ88_9CAUD|nr:hypothetical protein PP761_gp84 [Stenotrophomonas phage Paxi]QYW01811.1 hypothetical protein CPT_Paxi_045 [Stenotrophomonas phage Paxi]